jgi:hypothetical protein
VQSVRRQGSVSSSVLLTGLTVQIRVRNKPENWPIGGLLLVP